LTGCRTSGSLSNNSNRKSSGTVKWLAFESSAIVERAVASATKSIVTIRHRNIICLSLSHEESLIEAGGAWPKLG
jgi:hypothetical protein